MFLIQKINANNKWLTYRLAIYCFTVFVYYFEVKFECRFLYIDERFFFGLCGFWGCEVGEFLTAQFSVNENTNKNCNYT